LDIRLNKVAGAWGRAVILDCKPKK
jgi:hypothetical protein